MRVLCVLFGVLTALAVGAIAAFAYAMSPDVTAGAEVIALARRDFAFPAGTRFHEARHEVGFTRSTWTVAFTPPGAKAPADELPALAKSFGAPMQRASDHRFTYQQGDICYVLAYEPDAQTYRLTYSF